jgi:hypothetical protein
MKMAGIDVHKKVLMVVVLDASVPEEKPARRRFVTLPSELQRLRIWLQEQGVEARGTSTLLNNALLSAHYGPLRHPRRPGRALASCQLIPTAITAGASRVAPRPLCLHAVAHTPAGPRELTRSVLFPQRRPSPGYGWVGTCITSFQACSAFTRITTCRLAESPYATLYTRGSGGFVASTAALVATGWSDPVPGRVFLARCGPVPFHGAP